MIQPSCVSLTELDLCHQPAFPNIFYHTMQSYVLQVFEIVATTGVERKHSNRSSPAGLEHAKKRGGIHRTSPLFHILLRARDVAERPGDVRLRRSERSVDIRTVRTRQGSNTQETCCPLDEPFILVTYPHFICIANSFSTKKEDTHTGYPQKASTRRDSNPTRKKLCLILLYFRKDFKHFSLGVVIL